MGVVAERLKMFVVQEPVVAASCLIAGFGLFLPTVVRPIMDSFETAKQVPQPVLRHGGGDTRPLISWMLFPSRGLTLDPLEVEYNLWVMQDPAAYSEGTSDDMEYVAAIWFLKEKRWLEDESSRYFG